MRAEKCYNIFMEIITQNLVLFVVLITLWVMPWKAYALWTAVKKGDKKWFLILLLVNTFAILEIIYIFYVAKKTKHDMIKTLNSKI
jgi:hypothetical protein